MSYGTKGAGKTYNLFGKKKPLKKTDPGDDEQGASGLVEQIVH